MKVLKPEWINHDEGQSIFSLDIHPTEQKFVTGGQSENKGGLFIIWNLKAVIENDCASDTRHMLCRIEQAACINCVRWSKGGKCLAAAGDDHLVTIWYRFGKIKSAGTYGSEKPTNVEHWKCVNTLNGHSGDVLHVDWSPLDNYLASCSVDNTVVIWNAAKFPEKVTVLNGHSDMVKGVSWDPTGRFIASQSTDKTVKVWATANWECVKTVKGPFKESSNTTHVLRLGWGRDGQWLVTAHAMNNNGPTAQLIERNGWRTERDFVGHRKAVTCLKWSPALYKRKGDTGITGCFALGSRDRGVSIWQGCYFRPLVVLKNLFCQGISDLSWSGDGFCLMASSSDGTVACVVFYQEDLGRTLSGEEIDEYLKGLYGKAPKRLGSSGSGTFPPMINGYSCDIIDSPQVLKAQQEYRKQEQQKKDFSRSKVPDILQSTSQSSGGTRKKLENENSAQPSNNSKPSKETQAESKLLPVKQQLETETADGRRRIKPLFLDSAVEEMPQRVSTANRKDVEAAAIGATGFGATKKAVNGTEVAVCLEVGLEQSSKAQLEQSSSHIVDGLTSFNQDDSRIQTSTPCIPPAFYRTSVTDHAHKTLSLTSAEELVSGSSPACFAGVSLKRKPATATVSQPNKRSKKLKTKITESRKVKDAQVESASGNFLISVMNEAVGGRLTKVVCAKEDKLVWESVLTCPVACFSASRNWKEKVAVISNLSLSPLLSDDEQVTISSGRLTESGFPILSLSNRKSFTYSASLKAWVMLCDEECTVAKLSNVELSAEVHRGLGVFGPLASLCYSFNSGSGNGNMAHKTTKSMRGLAASSFIESRMQAALVLESPQEYSFWIRRYVAQLVRDGCEVKLKELCRELLGPVCRKATEKESFILGMNRRNLLQELLLMVSDNPKLQRLYTEFHTELEKSSENELI